MIKKVCLNETYFYLKKGLDDLDEKQSSSDSMPILYPETNKSLENIKKYDLKKS